MLRVGAIGAGMIFNAYDQAADCVPGLEIQAVVDLDQERLSRFARPGRSLFTDIDAFFRQPLDAVVILTPNCCHADHVRHCLDLGLPVLCEKPLALSAEEARDLLRASQARGTFLYVAMHCRHRPEVRFVRDNLRGHVALFEQSYLEDWTHAPAWYFDPAQSGGGVLLDVGINQIDWIFPFVQDLRVRSVDVGMGTSGVDVDCRITWDHHRGTGTTALSWQTTRERKTTRVGTESGDEFVLDHDAHSVVHNGTRKGPWPNREYVEVLAEFADLQNSGRPPGPPGPAEILDVLREVYTHAGLAFLEHSECERIKEVPDESWSIR